MCIQIVCLTWYHWYLFTTQQWLNSNSKCYPNVEFSKATINYKNLPELLIVMFIHLLKINWRRSRGLMQYYSNPHVIASAVKTNNWLIKQKAINCANYFHKHNRVFDFDKFVFAISTETSTMSALWLLSTVLAIVLKNASTKLASLVKLLPYYSLEPERMIIKGLLF